MKTKTIACVLSLLFAMPVFSSCPTDKPAQWIDNKCYSCQEIQLVVKDYVKKQKKTDPSKDMKSFLKMMEVFENLEQVCPLESQVK